MIRINLAKSKRERRKAFLGLGRMDINIIKNLGRTKDKFLFVPLLVGVAILILEGVYMYRLSTEEQRLKMVLEQLSKEKRSLEVQIREKRRREDRLKAKISELRRRISDIESQRNMLVAVKRKKEVFVTQFRSLISSVPGHIWFRSMKQRLSEPSKISVEISAGSYDVRSLLSFTDSLKKNFRLVNLGEIVKRTNEHGVVYYTTSISITAEANYGD